MLRSNVKINENMTNQELCDLEGDIGHWGQFVDLSDPKRRRLIYKQQAPKIKASIPSPFTPISEEEEYEFEESDHKLDFISKISTLGILLNTIYLIDYVLCKLPSKFWPN